MQTQLNPALLATREGQDAEAILRSCVHCGFCNATCPTYQLQGDELDGPRGRIYLIKMLLEGQNATAVTRRHLDRCLSCRACETTCPSGVHYGRLLDIGRGVVEQTAPRPWYSRLQRRALWRLMAYPTRFRVVLALAHLCRPLLPLRLAEYIPPAPSGGVDDIWPAPRHDRRMLVLEGCVQPVLAPSINLALARLLDGLGISLIRARSAGCCGALAYHLAAHEEGKAFMRRNIDAWWPHLDQGVEAIVVTASGCGVLVKDYAHVLRDDPDYADRAARISALARDPIEVLAAEPPALLRPAESVPRRIAFQSPCTLQHGQALAGRVEALLAQAGFDLVPVADPHLCCGSAGSYSLLQPALAGQLLDAKLEALGAHEPALIATANIGCLTHLQRRSRLPVLHWLSLLGGA
jgi:glycolate oxidase iron-sulfur subunit